MASPPLDTADQAGISGVSCESRVTAASTVSIPSPMVSVPFAGHSFTTPILPERHAIDLGDLAVDRLEPDAMDADRRVAQGIAHQRENAGRGVGAERAARMELQALVDISR